MIVPVILSGGSGTRLWPSSRELYPKQLLALTSEHSMLQETLLRLAGWVDTAPPIIVCHQEHRFVIAEQLHSIAITNATLILEPEAKNTAPAALMAALYAERIYGETAQVLILPADHLIQDSVAFQHTVTRAVAAAQRGYLVAFGVEPTSAETGYGYIRRGPCLWEHVYAIDGFFEKPSAHVAQQYSAQPDYWWNSGMLLCSASCYKNEIQIYAPTMLTACALALERATIDVDFLRLDPDAFAACPADSIDYALMEKTKNAVVVPLQAAWNDLGSWAALWDVAPKDQNANALMGDVFVHQVTNSYIRAEHKFVAAIGIDNQVIIETADAILIIDKNKTQEVKQVVKALQNQQRLEHHTHAYVYRPWGSYQLLDQGKNFQVKRLVVHPGAQLSLQLHRHRAEHWIVVNGTAKVTRDHEQFMLTENQSTYIAIGQKHRLENPTPQKLEIIEVQSGEYLGEDDILRFEDNYQRCDHA